jgi:hypothetical protein
MFCRNFFTAFTVFMSQATASLLSLVCSTPACTLGRQSLKQSAQVPVAALYTTSVFHRQGLHRPAS